MLGVDGCRVGWVAIELASGRFAGARLATTLGDLLSGADIVGVDMPLGLVEQGERIADRAAAAWLGPRRSSVFRVPPRAVWEEPDFATALARCRELTGAGFSRQAWNLQEKLREANACHRADPGRLHEVHPEVSFRAMAGAPLPHPKKTWAGQAARRRLLAEHGIILPEDLGPAGRAAPDDVLDAAAVAWSAHRIATGRARSLPDPPQPDGPAGMIAIWY